MKELRMLLHLLRYDKTGGTRSYAPWLVCSQSAVVPLCDDGLVCRLGVVCQVSYDEAEQMWRQFEQGGEAQLQTFTGQKTLQRCISCMRFQMTAAVSILVLLGGRRIRRRTT